MLTNIIQNWAIVFQATVVIYIGNSTVAPLALETLLCSASFTSSNTSTPASTSVPSGILSNFSPAPELPFPDYRW